VTRAGISTPPAIAARLMSDDAHVPSLKRLRSGDRDGRLRETPALVTALIRSLRSVQEDEEC